ncbi:MAG: NAD(P)/FAD-dependent oxidoreductase [Holophagales bacterium]|nr:NAD(P)/FAD-dependent oxidoreductase [Holophagales bacterium]
MSSGEPSDLLVVGGGPAGLAVAIAARLRGLGARVLDRRQPPIDKPCGEGLMPDGLACLYRLGVEVVGWPIRGIRYLDFDGPRPVRVSGSFPSPSGEAASRGLGVRRTALHAALVSRARDLGAELEWGTRVTGSSAASLGELAEVQTSAGTRRARVVVGADGLRSKVRSWAGIGLGETEPRRRQRFGVRRHFRARPWSDHVEVYWAEASEAYVTPVSCDEVGVAILWSGSKGDFDHHMERFPELGQRLAGAEHLSRDRGMGPLRQRPKTVVRGNVALVGDAAGYLDAITGEGLSLAFHQAEALVRSMAEGDLGSYARRHRRIVRLPEALTGLLLLVERRPWLRRRVLRAFEKDPRLFERFLAVHCREAPAWALGPEAPRLLWRLARG